MFIVYKGGDEVFVTTLEHEAKFIEEFFCASGMDTERDIQDFDREEVSEVAVWLSSRVTFP